jgi:hypothetical protein
MKGGFVMMTLVYTRKTVIVRSAIMLARHTAHCVLCVAVAFTGPGLAATSAAADEDCVRFDTLATVVACDVTPAEMAFEIPDQRLVQIVIPVSTRIGCPTNLPVMQMQIEVMAVGSTSVIIDYAPRTSMYSGIDGPITVESRKETSTNLGFDAGTSLSDAVRLTAKAGTGHTNGYSEHYQRIPEQQLLLASGTLERGRGVYFKFNQSPQTTLEGGHEISVTLRVPLTWRGGMFRVDCRAVAARENLFGKQAGLPAGSASFLVATWLKGDLGAQAVVNQYSELESRFRNFAASWQQNQNKNASRDPISQLFGGKPSPLPENWTEQFMLYDSRSIATGIRPHLSRDLQRAADQYLASRSNVLQLGR